MFRDSVSNLSERTFIIELSKASKSSRKELFFVHQMKTLSFLYISAQFFYGFAPHFTNWAEKSFFPRKSFIFCLYMGPKTLNMKKCTVKQNQKSKLFSLFFALIEKIAFSIIFSLSGQKFNP